MKGASKIVLYLFFVHIMSKDATDWRTWIIWENNFVLIDTIKDASMLGARRCCKPQHKHNTLLLLYELA